MLALMIDGLQALIGLGVSIVAAFPGTFAGGAAGCLAAQKFVSGSVSCAIGGFILGTLGSFGNVAAPITIPIGIVIGFAVDVCLSLTLGIFLIGMLYVCKMFYPGYVTAVFIGEALPGFDILPGWTLLAVRSVLKKSAEEGSGIASLASGVGSAILSPGSPTSGLGTVARGISNMKNITSTLQSNSATNNTEETPSRIPSTLQTKNFDGIKPANDNLKPYVQKAA